MAQGQASKPAPVRTLLDELLPPDFDISPAFSSNLTRSTLLQDHSRYNDANKSSLVNHNQGSEQHVAPFNPAEFCTRNNRRSRRGKRRANNSSNYGKSKRRKNGVHWKHEIAAVRFYDPDSEPISTRFNESARAFNGEPLRPVCATSSSLVVSLKQLEQCEGRAFKKNLGLKTDKVIGLSHVGTIGLHNKEPVETINEISPVEIEDRNCDEDVTVVVKSVESQSFLSTSTVVRNVEHVAGVAANLGSGTQMCFAVEEEVGHMVERNIDRLRVEISKEDSFTLEVMESSLAQLFPSLIRRGSASEQDQCVRPTFRWNFAGMRTELLAPK